MAKIFDCFTFFNELDVLDVRLAELRDVVDVFVICESTTTFKGQPKPLLFSENRARYGQYLSKIRHVVVSDMPDKASAWQREHHQRNALRRGFGDLGDGDIAIISDADEILRPSIVESLHDKATVYTFDMPMYQYYMNLEAKPRGWCKAFAFSGSLQSAISDYNDPRIDPAKHFKSQNLPLTEVQDAGWHFTFLGGADKVREKLRAYSHAGDVVDTLLSENGAERQIRLGQQVGNTNPLRLKRIDESFPNYVLKNQEILVAKGFIKDPFERVTELEEINHQDFVAAAGEMERRLVEMRGTLDFAQQRRAETGKRLAWMESRVVALKASLLSISQICGNGTEASVEQRLGEILNLCSLAADL